MNISSVVLFVFRSQNRMALSFLKGAGEHAMQAWCL